MRDSARRIAVLSAIALIATIPQSMSAAEPEARLSYGSQQVSWQPQADAQRSVLTVSVPGGRVVRREFNGADPSFDITEVGAVDGSYQWELRTLPATAPRVRSEAAVGGDAASRKRPAGAVMSGVFSVISGAVVAPGAAEPTRSQPLAPATRQASPGIQPLDVVTADDSIVQGSLCVGLDCVNNESFGFDTIRLKENNTRIAFDDTSTGTGFPNHDWQLTANDSAAGGANKFSIEDITAATIPMTITGSAPTNALFIDSTGRLGLGTAVPVLHLHINKSDTPAIRLEQNNSGGFTAQTWDVAGNEANFFVRDVTGGSRLPFRIRPGAPTSSIDISASGNVGIGTASPSVKLHVASSSTTGADGKVLIQNTAATTGPREMLEINNNGGAIFIIKDTSQAPRWSFGNSGTAFVIDNQANTGIEMNLSSTGNATFLGTVTPGSSRTIKQAFTEIEPRDVLTKVLALPITNWAYKFDPTVRHIGPMAEDFYSAFAVGANDKGISVTDSAGVALAAIQGLQQEIAAKDSEISGLKERLARLEATVQVLVNKP